MRTCPVYCRRPRSPSLRDWAVGLGDQLHQVAVGIVEIDAAAAVEMVDLARPLAAEIRIVGDARGADAGEGRVEFHLADQEREVSRVEVRGVDKSRVTPL